MAKPPLGNAMGMGLVHRRVPPSSKWSVSIYQTLDEKRQLKWFVVYGDNASTRLEPEPTICEVDACAISHHDSNI